MKRLARWITKFSEFNIDIRYRKGSEAIVPDAISRRPDFQGKGPANQAWIPSTSQETHLAALEAAKVLDEGFEWETALIAYAAQGNLEGLDLKQREILQGIPDLDQYYTEGGRLYRKVDKYYVPYIAPLFRRDFIEYFHRHYEYYSTPALDEIIRVRE